MAPTQGLAGIWTIMLIVLLSAEIEEARRTLTEKDIQFPPTVPSSVNMGSICLNSHCRHRYSLFPNSGFAYLIRRGMAINRLESAYSLCCTLSQPSQDLCCAIQAWKWALSKFCVDEYSTKTTAHECCASKGEARWSCFNTQPPSNPDYSCVPGYSPPDVVADLEFSFDPNAC